MSRKTDGVDFYLSAVNERFSVLTSAITKLYSAIAENNPDNQEKLAQITLSDAKHLNEILPQASRPSWLNALIGTLQNCLRAKKGTPNRFLPILELLLNNKKTIYDYKWVLDEEDAFLFDCDSIFERYKAESNLEQLLEQIIALLEKIMESGEIDSITIMNSLERVISTLKKNKSGSAFSLQTAWNFFKHFFASYLKKYLSDIPVLGDILTALVETIEHTDTELQGIQNKVNAELKTISENEIKNFEAKPFIGYNSEGRLDDNSQTSFSQKA